MSAFAAMRTPTSAPSSASFASAHARSSGGQPRARALQLGVEVVPVVADRPVERRVVDHARSSPRPVSACDLPIPHVHSACHGRAYPGCMASHLSDVWFSVTDLQVASGKGCWITTTDGVEYLDFTAGIAVASTGHCHPKVSAAIAQQAQRFIHAQVNCYHHDLLEPLADRLAEITPGEHRHVLLRELGCGDHRSRGEARQAGDGPTARDRVLRQLPRAHAPDDGDDDVEGGLPRRARAAAAGHLRRAVPRSARARHRRRDRPLPRGARPPARRADRAGRDRGDDHRARAR